MEFDISLKNGLNCTSRFSFVAPPYDHFETMNRLVNEMEGNGNIKNMEFSTTPIYCYHNFSILMLKLLTPLVRAYVLVSDKR